MKKCLSLLLAGVLLLSISACAAPTEPPVTTTEAPTVPTPSEEEILAQIEDCLWGKTFRPDSALSLARELAEGGSDAGMYHAGKILLDGMGEVRPDIEEAMMWLEKGASLGNSDCMTLLGFVYVYGTHGQAQDRELGIGELYERGLGVAKSRDTAQEWFQKALEEGEYLAQEALDRVNESE